MYIKIPFKYKKLGALYLIISDFGDWLFLSRSELDKFIKLEINGLPKNLTNKLAANNLIVRDKDLNEIFHKSYKKQEMLYAGPSIFLIHITKNCNLSCIYCHASAVKINDANKNGSESDISEHKYIEYLSKFILNTPAKDITLIFQGGEPLLEYKKIKNIIINIKQKNRKIKKNIKYQITTNLTIISKDILKFIKEENIYLSGSIDGTAEVHQKHRLSNDKTNLYPKIIKTTDLYFQNDVSINILSLISKHNLSQARTIVDLQKKYNNKLISINLIQKQGRASESKTWMDIGINGDEFYDFWTNTVNYIRTINIQGGNIMERYHLMAIQKIFFKEEPGFVDWQNPCGAVKNIISIDYNGNIYPCTRINNPKFVLGSIYKKDYKFVAQNNTAKKIIKSSILEGDVCDYCIYKPYCGICPTQAYELSKRFRSHKWKTSYCLFYKKLFSCIFNTLIHNPADIYNDLTVARKLLKKDNLPIT